MTALTDFLTRTPGEAPEPIVAPDGTYIFEIRGYRVDEVGQNNTPKLTFNVVPVVIEEGDLEEAQLQFVEALRHEYFLTDKAEAHKSPNVSVARFLSQTLGLDEDESYEVLFEQATGKTFRGQTKTKMVETKRGTVPIAEIVRVLPADD